MADTCMWFTLYFRDVSASSRYLDDLLNTDNPYFEGMVNRIIPLIPKPHFCICIYLFQTDLFHLEFMTLILI